MIHHISVAAENPQHVAEVLAEIWHGKVAPFPPHPGSYVVLSLDQHGSMIEVYPRGTEIIPAGYEEQAGFVINPGPSRFGAVHAAVSVPASLEQIEEIGRREGWRTISCDRDGLFNVIEFWVENSLMIELLPPDYAAKYLNFMEPQSLEEFFMGMAAA